MRAMPSVVIIDRDGNIGFVSEGSGRMRTIASSPSSAASARNEAGRVARLGCLSHARALRSQSVGLAPRACDQHACLGADAVAYRRTRTEAGSHIS